MTTKTIPTPVSEKDRSESSDHPDHPPEGDGSRPGTAEGEEHEGEEEAEQEDEGEKEEDEEEEGDEEEEEAEDEEEEAEDEEGEDEEEGDDEEDEEDDDDDIVALKIQVANESFVRMLKVPSSTTFRHFVHLVAHKCGLTAGEHAPPKAGTRKKEAPEKTKEAALSVKPSLRISYYDEEGDLIDIDSAKVMRRAFEQYSEGELEFLRVVVYPPGASFAEKPLDVGSNLRVPPRPMRATPTTPMFAQATFSSSTTTVISPMGNSAVRCPTPVATSRNVSSEIIMGRTSTSDIVVSSSSVGHTFDGLQQGQELLWTQLKVLGRGSFGTVYEGLTSDGILMAVKVIEMPTDTSNAGEDIKGLMKEINLMRKLSHKNIVAYYGCQAVPNPTGAGMQLQIFLEHCPDGSLTSLRNRYDPVNGRFSVQLARHYTRSVLEGLAYLHSQGIIHRDIKGDNVLITATGDAKLADFGCSRRLAGVMESQSQEKMAKTLVGTPFFMAPEMVNAESSSGYSYQADIWGLGCLTIEMFGRKPWIVEGGGNIYSLMFRIASTNETPNGVPPNCPPLLADFFRECFIRDPKQRMGAQAMLQHPWMTCGDDELEEPGWETSGPVGSGASNSCSGAGTMPTPAQAM